MELSSGGWILLVASLEAKVGHAAHCVKTYMSLFIYNFNTEKFFLKHLNPRVQISNNSSISTHIPKEYTPSVHTCTK